MKYDYALKEPLSDQTRKFEKKFKEIEEGIIYIEKHNNIDQIIKKNQEEFTSNFKVMKEECKNLMDAVRRKLKEQETLKQKEGDLEKLGKSRNLMIEDLVKRIDVLEEMNEKSKTLEDWETEAMVIEARKMHLLNVKKDLQNILSKVTDKEIKVESLYVTENMKPSVNLDRTINSIGEEAKEYSRKVQAEIERQTSMACELQTKSLEETNKSHQKKSLLDNLIEELKVLTIEKEQKESEVKTSKEELNRLKWQFEQNQKEFKEKEINFNYSEIRQIFLLLLILLFILGSYLFYINDNN